MVQKVLRSLSQVIVVLKDMKKKILIENVDVWCHITVLYEY